MSLSVLGQDGENSLAVCSRFRFGMVIQQTARDKREKLSRETFRLGMLLGEVIAGETHEGGKEEHGGWTGSQVGSSVTRGATGEGQGRVWVCVTE